MDGKDGMSSPTIGHEARAPTLNTSIPHSSGTAARTQGRKGNERQTEWSVVFAGVVFSKAAVNAEFANAEPLLLGGMYG